jgi:hypothetical protein
MMVMCVHGKGKIKRRRISLVIANEELWNATKIRVLVISVKHMYILMIISMRGILPHFRRTSNEFASLSEKKKIFPKTSLAYAVSQLMLSYTEIWIKYGGKIKRSKWMSSHLNYYCDVGCLGRWFCGMLSWHSQFCLIFFPSKKIKNESIWQKIQNFSKQSQKNQKLATQL